MAADDTLSTLGEKVTDLFAGAYAGGNPNVSLVFLPFSVPVPDDIVQGGVVNPARLGAFFVANFDAPYVVSPQQSSAHGKDDSYGSASQIYATAVALAQAAAAPGSPAESRVNAEIMMARRVLDPSGPAVAMSSQPDDWVVPENTSYWTVFDSAQSQTPPAPPPATAASPPRIFNSALWTIRPAIAQAASSAPVETVHAASPPLAHPLIASASPVLNHPAVTATSAPAIRPNVAAFSPAILGTAIHPSPAPPGRPMIASPWLLQRHFAIAVPPVHPPLPVSPPIPAPPPPSSSVAIHFEYMSVTMGYTVAGLPIWNEVFLSDRSWYIAGMARGALLPAPSSPAPPPAPQLVYGLPTSLVVVRKVTIAVKWSGQEQATLGTSGGFLGPFSVSGVTPNIAPDGTWTYARPGMQVIALMCNHLPVLPPIDAPDVDLTSAPAPAGSTSAPAPAAPAPPSAPLPLSADASSPATDATGAASAEPAASGGS